MVCHVLLPHKYKLSTLVICCGENYKPPDYHTNITYTQNQLQNAFFTCSNLTSAILGCVVAMVLLLLRKTPAAFVKPIAGTAVSI